MQRAITPVLTTSQLDYIARRVAEYLARNLQPEETLMDVKQCAVFLNMKESAVLRQVQRGYIPGHKVHGRWRFLKNELIKAIKDDSPAGDCIHI